MKIALCLFGNLRQFDLLIPTLQNNVIQPFCPDVFSFVWRNTSEQPVNKFDRNHPFWNIKNVPKPKKISNDYIHSLITKINPKISLISDYENPSFEYNPDWQLPQAYYKNLWAQYQCVKKKQEYENYFGFKYDLVIMSRWDIFYENQIDFENKNRVVFPRRFWISGPSDWWMYGPSHLIDLCSSRFEQNNLNYHPNKLLNHLLEHYNIPHEQIDIPVNLLNRPY